MKMFKKIMAVALVGVMALSMLTGCAVTNAIIEDKAETALENAWSTEKKEVVNFKSDKFTDTDAYKKAKKDVENGTVKVKDGEATLFTQSDANYTVVVVAEPSSAKKVKNWNGLAKTVLVTAGWNTGIYVNGTNSKTAKVDIDTGIKGKNATEDKNDTYTIFVFAKTETAYNK